MLSRRGSAQTTKNDHDGNRVKGRGAVKSSDVLGSDPSPLILNIPAVVASAVRHTAPMYWTSPSVDLDMARKIRTPFLEAGEISGKEVQQWQGMDMVKLSVVHNASLHSFYELFSLPSCQNPCRFLCVSTTSLQPRMTRFCSRGLQRGRRNA